jgi:hypothetical protein
VQTSASGYFARLQVHIWAMGDPRELEDSWTATWGILHRKADSGIIGSTRRGYSVASVLLRISLTVLTSEKGSRTSFSIGSRTLVTPESKTSQYRSVLRPAASYLTDALRLALVGALRLVSLPIRRTVPRRTPPPRAATTSWSSVARCSRQQPCTAFARRCARRPG